MVLCGRKRNPNGNLYDVWIEGPSGNIAVKGKVRTVLKVITNEPKPRKVTDAPFEMPAHMRNQERRSSRKAEDVSYDAQAIREEASEAQTMREEASEAQPIREEISKPQPIHAESTTPKPGNGLEFIPGAGSISAQENITDKVAVRRVEASVRPLLRHITVTTPDPDRIYRDRRRLKTPGTKNSSPVVSPLVRLSSFNLPSVTLHPTDAQPTSSSLIRIHPRGIRNITRQSVPPLRKHVAKSTINVRKDQASRIITVPLT
jgi:hypothetical protein